MSIRAILHGVRVGIRHYRCQHPAMQHATITVVGGHYCVGVWWCPDCQKTLPDSGPVSAT